MIRRFVIASFSHLLAITFRCCDARLPPFLSGLLPLLMITAAAIAALKMPIARAILYFARFSLDTIRHYAEAFRLRRYFRQKAVARAARY